MSMYVTHFSSILNAKIIGIIIYVCIVVMIIYLKL